MFAIDDQYWKPTKMNQLQPHLDVQFIKPVIRN